MQCLAPLGGVYQAGTFSGNPVVMRAGLTGLRLLNAAFYKRLNDRCAAFVEDINGYFQTHDIPAHIAHYRSMMSIRFRKEPVLNYADAQAAKVNGLWGTFRAAAGENVTPGYSAIF